MVKKRPPELGLGVRMGLTPVYGSARKGDGVAGVALGEGAGGGEGVGGTAGERVAGFVAEAVDSFGEGERFDAEAGEGVG